MTGHAPNTLGQHRVVMRERFEALRAAAAPVAISFGQTGHIVSVGAFSGILQSANGTRLGFRLDEEHAGLRQGDAVAFDVKRERGGSCTVAYSVRKAA
jgi:hypothetical protein